MKHIQPKPFKVVRLKHWWESLNTWSYKSFILILKEDFTREDLFYAYLEKFNPIILTLPPVEILSCKIKILEDGNVGIHYGYGYHPKNQTIGRLSSITLGITDEEFST